MDEMRNNLRTGRDSDSKTIPINNVSNKMGHRRNVGGGRQTFNSQRVINNNASQSRFNRKQATVAPKRNIKNPEKTISILDKIIAFSIFMLFFGLPIFFLNVAYQGLSLEKQYYFYFWTFLGVIALAARGILGGKIEIRRTSIDIPLGILWLVYVVATIFSVDKFHSFFGFFGTPVNGLISFTSLILAYYLIVSFISRKRVMMVWWAVVAGGGVVVIETFLVMMRLLPQSVFKYIAVNLIGSFASLAAFLTILLPIFVISLTLLDNAGTIKRKFFAALIVIVTTLDLVVLSTLFDYVQWYVLIAAVALVLVFTISRFVQVSQKTSALSVFVFLLIVGFFVYGQPLFTRIITQPEVSLTYGLSFDIAKKALKNKPLLGTGPGTYGYNFSLYRPKDLNMNGQYDIRFFSDRGILMESLSTVGIVGSIALIVVILTYINTVIHAFLQVRDNQTKALALGLFVSSFMALIYALFWSVDGIIVLYGILLAALTIGLLRDGADDGSDNKLVLSMTSTPQNALSFAFLSILVAVGIIFGFVTLGKMFVADVYAGQALRAKAKSDFNSASAKFMRAVSFNKQEGRYFTVISQYGLALANAELAKGEQANKEMVTNYINSAVGAATTGRKLMPNDVLANETAGFIYENSGNKEAVSMAYNAYNRAHELEPQNPYLDIALGRLKLAQAQMKSKEEIEDKKKLIEEAKGMFESARDKTTFEVDGQEISLFSPAYYYIAIVDEALDDLDGAITAMKKALQITQLDRNLSQQQLMSRKINYGFNLARLLQKRGTDEDNKIAEALLLEIIGVNDKEINSHLNLGLLYERTNRRDEAIAEYKKILEILPEDDSKARENIQGLIDTIEQGGSNIGDKNTATQGSVDENDNEQTEENVDNDQVSMLIVAGKDATSIATDVRDVLKQNNKIDLTKDIRTEEDQKENGVTVQYNGNVEQKLVDDIKSILENKFNNVIIERDDANVDKYNHDLVVFVGNSEE